MYGSMQTLKFELKDSRKKILASFNTFTLKRQVVKSFPELLHLNKQVQGPEINV